MAIFKVGQRVRIVGPMDDPQCQPFIGTETVVTSEPFEKYGTTGYRTAFTDLLKNCLGVPAKNLVPLTPADAFIASIKAMKPYEEPKVGKKEGVKHG